MNRADEQRMVERHVREGESHIARQREIVAELLASGRDARLAKSLLARFDALQAEHLAHLDRIA